MSGRSAARGRDRRRGDEAPPYAHGFVTRFGDTGSVGVAGITLGGGVGWLVRKHGMTIDSLLAVEIVTADGRRRIASAVEDPDLFWADPRRRGELRRRHAPPVPAPPAGRRPRGRHPPAGHARRAPPPGPSLLLAAPDELTTMPTIMLAPEDPAIPRRRIGERPVVYLSVVWSGPPTPVSRRWRRCAPSQRR